MLESQETISRILVLNLCKIPASFVPKSILWEWSVRNWIVKLRFEIYKTKEKVLYELPSTSSTIRGHLLRSHYFVHLCSNLLESCSKILEPANYGWIIENGLLVPTKNFATLLSYLTTKCRCKKGCRKNCGCKRTFKKCIEYYNCTNCESK